MMSRSYGEVWDMINKTRLLTGLTLGWCCRRRRVGRRIQRLLLQRLGRRRHDRHAFAHHMDKAFDTAWVQNAPPNMADDYNNRSDATGTLILTDLLAIGRRSTTAPASGARWSATASTSGSARRSAT